MDIYRKTVKRVDAFAKQIQIQEEGDIFLDYLNKRLRNINKTIDQIEQLEKSQSSLNPDQQQKVNSKRSKIDEMLNILEMKQQYFTAHEKVKNTQTKDIMKKSENSLIVQQVKKAQSDALQLVYDVIQVGKFISNRNRIPKQINISEEQERNIFHFYDKFINLQPQLADSDKTHNQHRQECQQQLLDYLNEQNESVQQLKSTINQIVMSDKFQKIPVSELKQEEESDNEEVQLQASEQQQQQECTQVIEEVEEDEKNKQEKQESSNTENAQNYDGDSEKSYKQSEPDSKKKDSLEQGSNQSESKRNKGNHQNRYHKKNFYQPKKTFEDQQYSDHYYRKRDQGQQGNKQSNRNPGRKNYNNKDYDTDKEKDQYRRKDDGYKV